MTNVVPPIKKELIVKTTPARAFAIFTDGIDTWWPREHHIGKSPMKRTLIEPRQGGRWYAISEDGSECDVGRVLAWEPPNRLVLAWQITANWAFDPSFVTEIEVRFAPLGPKSTAVSFEHRLLERYGEPAAALRTRLDDPKGWHVTLDTYARVAGTKAVVFYESSAEVMQLAPLHFPAHKARVDAFHERGELLAVGTYADPREGSMAVFTDRTAAAAFVAADPFVLHGVVAKHTIKDWKETLL
ncbi:MAG TPA: SRPBCC domain-containing protein [Polyangiaceae bacterium]|nr:SRPBCC domain-containing protein [Polyangiaceae bacterium]